MVSFSLLLGGVRLTININGTYLSVWDHTYFGPEIYGLSCYFQYPHRKNIPLIINYVDSEWVRQTYKKGNKRNDRKY